MFRKQNITVIFLVIVILLTACSSTKEQVASRSVRSSSILVSSESSDEQSGSLDNPYSIEKIPSTSKQIEFDSNISFSDHFLVVDYGKSRVNVYQAIYAQPAALWKDTWLNTWPVLDMWRWASGDVTSLYLEENDSSMVLVQDHDTSISNLQNVHVATLNEINDHEEIEKRMGINHDSSFLCWTFEVKDFPVELFEKLHPYPVNSVDVNSYKCIKFARIGAQYIDGLPVYADDRDTRSCITYEWPGTIKPSRIAYYKGESEAMRIAPSQPFVIELDKGRYTITRALKTNQVVVLPDTCLDEIKRSLAYRPQTNGRLSNDPSKPDLLDIWNKDIELYCAELSFVALDSCPRDYDEKEESLLAHEIALVPVWEFYYTISNPDNLSTVEHGTVLINAVTGKSLYSEHYGADENKELYPELNSKG